MVPVALQTGLTEAVTARGRNGLNEDLQTDGASELILREHLTPGRANALGSQLGLNVPTKSLSSVTSKSSPGNGLFDTVPTIYHQMIFAMSYQVL